MTILAPVATPPCIRCQHEPARHVQQTGALVVTLVCQVPGCSCTWLPRDAPWRKP